MRQSLSSDQESTRCGLHRSGDVPETPQLACRMPLRVGFPLPRSHQAFFGIIIRDSVGYENFETAAVWDVASNVRVFSMKGALDLLKPVPGDNLAP